MAIYFCATCKKSVKRAPSQVFGAIYCSRLCQKNARACPFTAQELYILHFVQMRGQSEIAALASETQGWQPVATAKVAKRWLIEAGYTPRTNAEHNAFLAQQGHSAKNAIRAREKLAQLRTQGIAFHGDASYMHTPEAKARQRAAAANRRKRETRVCAAHGCENLVTRIPSQFVGNGAYCSKSCAARTNNYRRYNALSPVKGMEQWVRNAKIVTALRAGETARQLAGRYGLSAAQIYLIAERVTGKTAVALRREGTIYALRPPAETRDRGLLRNRSLPSAGALYRSARNSAIIERLQRGEAPRAIADALRVPTALVSGLKRQLREASAPIIEETRADVETETIDLEAAKAANPELYAYLVEQGRI